MSGIKVYADMDWPTFLRFIPQQENRLDREDYGDEAMMQAQSWSGCAVADRLGGRHKKSDGLNSYDGYWRQYEEGEKGAFLKRYDLWLYTFGRRFLSALERRDYPLALQIYDAIQRHVLPRQLRIALA